MPDLKKKIPEFKSEEEAFEFWSENDSADYLDWSKAQAVRFPNLKKTTKSVSIRLPVDMIETLKVRAHSMDIPYQSLIKMLLHEGMKKMGA